jgi:superfamily II DNA or RNA helicase
MTGPPTPSDGKLPTLLDNTAGRTVLDALRALLPSARNWDLATGFFEIGAFPLLDGLWQPVEKVRLVMGDETTRRTRRELVEALRQQSDESIESAKERDDSLTGLHAVRAALAAKQLEARVYTRAKFHAKAHYLETKPPTPVNYGLIGSSNFTEPGLTRNLELNLFTTDASQLAALKAWYDGVWAEAEDVRAELLHVLEPHLREYTPFEVWAKALYEYFAGRETPATTWEEEESVIFRLLSQYQKDGYHQALRLAETRGGALLCDGVGLGKTFIGLMLLEHHLHRGEKVLLIVPKSAKESVWERFLHQYLRPRYRRAYRDNVQVHAMTDFGREGTVSPDDLEYYRDYFHAVLVDEAHHFRTPGASRSQALYDLAAGKRLYFLTATPINNSLLDLYHLLSYMTRRRPDYFGDLGIHDLRKHISEAERKLEQETGVRSAPDAEQLTLDLGEAVQQADLLRTDVLLRAIVIQRSRAYVRESETAGAGAPLFPTREKPVVVPYSLRKVYAGLYTDLRAAFGKKEPLLKFALYNPEGYRKADAEGEVLNRERQLVGLLRTLFLKRLESSYKAFEASVEDLLRKMAGWLEHHDPESLAAWQTEHAKQWGTIEAHWQERQQWETGDEAEEEDDLPPPKAEVSAESHDLPTMTADVTADMTELAKLLAKVYSRLTPENDDKLQQLVSLLTTDPRLKREKLIVFTEFRDTARYLFRQLRDARGFTDIEELDSTRSVHRESVIKRFAPFYNCTDDADRAAALANPIRVLVSTDVLSEGLNLQDASLILNYDVHWNPVRLMQRIGRVDRRLSADIEAALGRDPTKVTVAIYNFLPPQELDELLGLLHRVSGKVVRISRTLGIEAPVLRPDDDLEALRLFNETYEGEQSAEERLHLELQQLQHHHPDLWKRLPALPRRLFSARPAGCQPAPHRSAGIPPARGLFCCYRFPALDPRSEI